MHTFKTTFHQTPPAQGEDLKSPRPEDLSGEEEGKGKGEDKVEVDQIEQVVRVNLFTI